MRASLRVALLAVSVLVLGSTAQADIAKTIDFDDLWTQTSVNGDDIPAVYPFSQVGYSAAYDVKNGAFVSVGPLEIHDATFFGQPSGAVAMSQDLGSQPSYWGEVSLTVADAANFDLILDSFLLCQHESWRPIIDDEHVAVTIIRDGVLEQSDYWALNPNNDQVVLVQPDPLLRADNIVIRWNYPYNLAIDEINFRIVDAVPEPATLVSWVLGLAALGLVGFRRLRRTGV